MSGVLLIVIVLAAVVVRPDLVVAAAAVADSNLLVRRKKRDAQDLPNFREDRKDYILTNGFGADLSTRSRSFVGNWWKLQQKWKSEGHSSPIVLHPTYIFGQVRWLDHKRFLECSS